VTEGESRGRERATFSTALRAEFAFLDELGFRVEEDATDAIGWTRDDRSLRISRDWRDGFVDASLADHGAKLAFGLRQALIAIGREDLIPAHGWQAWRADTQGKYVAELAQLIRAHLVDFLGAPTNLWESANRLAQDEAHAHTQGLRSRQLRSRAEQARTAKNWSEVARAYQRLAEAGLELTAAEEARWHLARRMIESE
jgi:hypothetical protein